MPNGRNNSLGSIDLTFVFIIFIIILGFALSGSWGNRFPTESNTGEVYVPEASTIEESKNSLQLGNLKFTRVIIPTQPPSPPSCTTSVSDTVIVIDSSGSMSGEKLAKAKAAAIQFVNAVSPNTATRVGLVKFSKNSELLSGLTSELDSIRTAINGMGGSGGSCVQCGIKTANQEIQANFRPDVRNFVILLTDARANHVDGKHVIDDDAIEAARDEALAIFTTRGTVFYTIGFGNNVNTSFMQGVANETGGSYFFSPTADTLFDAFLGIANRICQQ